MNKQIPHFGMPELEKISEIFGDTVTGFTGTEIGVIFTELGIQDSVHSTKRRRLCDALANQQVAEHSGTIVIKFLENVMKPVRYINNHSLFDDRRDQLNQILSLSGLYI